MPINSKYLAKFEASGYYHIFNRCHSHKMMFIEERNYDYFLHLAEKYLSPYMEFYAYCLLPNHFHFLSRIKEENHSELLDKKVSNQFRRFFISYTNALNKEYKLHGGLFATPFRRMAIDSDDYLTRLICYIHCNPVHHGICVNPDGYKFSSYLSIIKNFESIINREQVLRWFGNLDEFKSFHNSKAGTLGNLTFDLE